MECRSKGHGRGESASAERRAPADGGNGWSRYRAICPAAGDGHSRLGQSSGWRTTRHKNMHAKQSRRSLCLIAPVFAVGALLGGCSHEDHSKPDLNDIKTALQERYGECPLWTLGSVRRIDGASNPDGYEVSYSFVLTLKDPGELIGHGANVTQEDARYIAAVTMGDTSDPCFYGAFPLAAVISQEQAPLANRYQATGDRIFVQSEQGWHLNTAPPNPRDPSTYDQFAPIDDATAAALQASLADADAGLPARNGEAGGTQSIFHRLNLLVLSLFRGGGSHSDDAASVQAPASIAAPASTTSEPAPIASPVEDASSVAAGDVASDASAPAVAASVADALAPAVSQPVPSGAPSNALRNWRERGVADAGRCRYRSDRQIATTAAEGAGRVPPRAVRRCRCDRRSHPAARSRQHSGATAPGERVTRPAGGNSQSVAAASNRASADADIGDTDDARATAGEPGAGTRGP